MAGAGGRPTVPAGPGPGRADLVGAAAPTWSGRAPASHPRPPAVDLSGTDAARPAGPAWPRWPTAPTGWRCCRGWSPCWTRYGPPGLGALVDDLAARGGRRSTTSPPEMERVWWISLLG